MPASRRASSCATSRTSKTFIARSRPWSTQPTRTTKRSDGGGDVSKLAVVGGGQLARMMQQAAIGLGTELRLLAEGPDVSAAQVIPDHIVGDYTNLDDLRAVAEGASVITFDHEQV